MNNKKQTMMKEKMMKLFSTIVCMLSLSMTMATFGGGRFVLTPGLKRSLTVGAIGAGGLGVTIQLSREIRERISPKSPSQKVVKKLTPKPSENPVVNNKATEKPFEIHMKSRS